MSTNLKFAYPDITFNAVSVISSETYATDNPVINLIAGSRVKYAELATELIGQNEIEFDLGSGVEQAADYVALVNAKRLKSSGVDYVRLRGSDYSYQYPTSMIGIFDPERDVTYDSAMRISQVSDQSGNSNHATQSTDGNKPLLSRADNKENLALYSEDISNAAWVLNDVTKTSNTTANPVDGLVTADTMTEGVSVGDWHRIQQIMSVITGKTYRMSAYVKRGTGTRHFAIWLRGAAFPSDNIAYFDLGTGAVYSNTTATATIEDLGDGWCRCSVTQAAAATSASAQFNLQMVATLGGVAYTGDGTSSLHIFGMQFQDSSADTTYLSTTSFQEHAGINGNRCLVFDGSNDYLLANGIATALTGTDTPFTLIAVVFQNNPSTSNTAYFSLGRNASNAFHRHDLLSTTCETYRRDDAATTVSAIGGASTATVTTWSYVFTGTNVSVYKNGSVVINNASLNNGAATFDRFAIGAGYFAGSLVSYLNGKIAFMAVADSAIGTTDREAWEGYLSNRFSTTPLADIDLQNATLTGGQGKDYIETFTESAAFRYWIAQFITNTASSKRPLGKLYFGKLLDLNRDPQLGSIAQTSHYQDKAMHEKKLLSLEYQGISATKKQELEEKILQYRDTNEVLLHTTTYDTPLLNTDLLSVKVNSANTTTRGARQNDIRLEVEETY